MAGPPRPPRHLNYIRCKLRAEIISHDRYFLDRAVTRILLLEGGRLQEYPGGYSDYAEARRLV